MTTPQMPQLPQKPALNDPSLTQSPDGRIIQGYGTWAQINEAKKRANQMIQRSLQVIPGLIGTGSQIGGGLVQLLNAYVGSKMLKNANTQEDALTNAIASEQAKGLHPQGSSYSQTPQQSQPFAQQQIAQSPQEQAQ